MSAGTRGVIRNLVSCESWDHFWLNEGWTRFVETKIMERIEGKGVAHLKVNEGLKALQDAVTEFEGKGEGHYTRLVQVRRCRSALPLCLCARSCLPL